MSPFRSSNRPGGPRRDARGGRSRDGGAARSGGGSRASAGGGSRRPDRGGDAPRPARDRAPRRANLDPEKLVARQAWSALRPLLERAHADVEPTLARLRSYAISLLEWNRGVSNLISRHDEERLVERHIAESIQPAALLRESGCERFVDLGSGAGLPAIPLAIAGVGRSWSLVESRRNKTLFMRKASEDLELKGIEVLCARLEVAIEEDADALACDGFTSRATMTVGPTLEMAARIVRSGGSAFLWKGSSYSEEMVAAEAEWQRSWSFEAAHPIGEGPNVIAVFKRK